MVECDLAKVEVAGSNPVSRSNFSPDSERKIVRRSGEAAKADELRKKLEEVGVILEDTPKGTRWRRKH